jgi:RNA polymerase sigma factor (sigma-70 family)
LTGESRTVEQLRWIAARLSVDRELRKDLMQEMFMHLVQQEANRPGQTRSWYIQSCRFRARTYLNHGRSVDSIKRGKNLVSLGQSDYGDDRYDFCHDLTDPIDLRSELITRDILALLLPHLTDIQQRILFLLMHGFGLREIGREIHISHPMVIKHRKKIALIASDLLTDAVCIGSRNDASDHSVALVAD